MRPTKLACPWLRFPVGWSARSVVCLAPINSGLFEAKTPPYRPDKACYVHNCTTQGRSPTVVPARFLVACKHGHLDDFPWLDFVHRGQPDCKGPLRMYELGVSGEAADVEVKCDKCGAVRRMAEAFGRDNEVNLPHCRGRHPHLRTFAQDGCEVEHLSAILQGASNSWFPVMLSALSVPHSTDKLDPTGHGQLGDVGEGDQPGDPPSLSADRPTQGTRRIHRRPGLGGDPEESSRVVHSRARNLPA